MKVIVTSLSAALALTIAGAVEAAADRTAAAAGTAAVVEACDPGCRGPNCCDPGTLKVCKVVVEMKTVRKHVWVVECEEHCPALPGSSLFNRCKDGFSRSGIGCVAPAACGTPCGVCGPCAALHAQVPCPPKCGTIRSRKVLKRKEIEYEVPVYRCVVVSHTPSPDRAVDCHAVAPANEPAATHQTPAPSAPLPPVIGTSYLQ